MANKFEIVDLPKGYEIVDIPALTPFQKQARARKLGIDVETNRATAEQEIANATGAAFGQIGKGLVLGAAALGTGGFGAVPAASLMGLGGSAGEVADQYLRASAGSTDVPKSAKALAAKVGLEGAWSAAGEGGARAITSSLRYLGSEWPGLVMRSAAKSQEGQNVLKRLQRATFDDLREFVRTSGSPRGAPGGTPVVDLGDEIKAFYDTIGKRATGPSEAFETAMKPINAKLGKAGGGVLSKQPLDALMEIKSDLSHVTYKVKGMNTDEFVALENLTKAVDRKIERQLDLLGGEPAKKLWGNYKAFSEQIKSDETLGALAEEGVRKLLGKAAGYVPGVDTTIDTVVRAKISPWVLNNLFSDPKTKALVNQAMTLQKTGREAAAARAFEAAINASGVGTLLADWLKPDKRAEVFKAFSDAEAQEFPVLPAP